MGTQEQVINPEFLYGDEGDAVGGGGSESTTKTKVDNMMGLGMSLVLPLVLNFTPAPQVNITTDSTPPPNQAMMKLLAYTQNDASMAQPVVGTPNAVGAAGQAVDQARTRLNIVNDAMKGMQAQGGGQNNTANVTVAPVMASSTTMLGAGLGSQVTALQQVSTYSFVGSSGGTESKKSRDATPTYTFAMSAGPNDATVGVTPGIPTPGPGMNTGGLNGGRSVSDGMAYASASLSGVAGINIADMNRFKNDAMSVLPAAKTIFEKDPATTFRAQRLDVPKAPTAVA